ncbi:MAG: TolB family protein, partial [Actinomycetes bacterium]
LDVFVHDRRTGATTRVSVASDGSQSTDYSGNLGLALSADGRYVVFDSYANNLVPGDTNGVPDVFVHDRQTGTTSRISVASDGSQVYYGDISFGLALSADGRYVAFGSSTGRLVPGDTNGKFDVFVHDRRTGTTSRVSLASDGRQVYNDSGQAVISADGRHVGFMSFAGRLVPGDSNGAEDVFVHDRRTGATSRVSVASDGSQANEANSWPAVSADGRHVAFISRASNLVTGDTNRTEDVFVRIVR